MKKTLSTILCLLVFFSSFSANLIPEGFSNEIDKENLQYNRVSGYRVTENDIYVTKDELTFDTFSLKESLPAQYDLRDYDRVTSVKDQGPFGTCWAFAFCAAAESNLITQGQADTSIDLSEAHLAYFTACNETSDGNEDKLVNIDPFNGGQYYNATATVSRGSGFALEQDFPYEWSISRGNSTSKPFQYVISDGAGNSYVLDASGMTYHESEKFASNYSLQDVKFLTSFSEIKENVIKNGAVATSIYYDENQAKDSNSGWAYYYKNSSAVNHAITIVGWDDSFSAYNFAEKAPGNGAWLIKNSWGEDDPYSDDGYFWLSYYNMLNTPVSITMADSEYSSIYYYDDIHPQVSNLYFRTDTVKLANVFKAKEDTLITGTSFYTPFDEGDVYPISIKAQIYTGLTNKSKPNTGTFAGEVSGVYNSFGCYTLNFEEPIFVNQNETFSIVLIYDSPLTDSTPFPCEFNTANMATYNSFTASAGESFISNNNGSTWTDFTSFSDANTEFCNVCIKALGQNPIDEELIISALPKTTYFQYDKLDISGLKVLFKNNTGSTTELNPKDLIISGFNSDITGNQTISISYNDITTSFNITVLGLEDIFKTDMFFLNEIYKSAVRDNSFYERYAESEQNLISGFMPGVQDLNAYLELNEDFSMQYDKVGTGHKIDIFYKGEPLTTFTMVIWGDVTGDGIYDGQDAVIVSCIVNGMINKETAEDSLLIAADITQDTNINEKDINALNKAGVLLSEIELRQDFIMIAVKDHIVGDVSEEVAKTREYLSISSQKPIIEEESPSDLERPDGFEEIESEEGETIEIPQENKKPNNSMRVIINFFKALIQKLLLIFKIN